MLRKLAVVAVFVAAQAAHAQLSLDRDRTQVLIQSDAGGSNESGDEFGGALAGGDLDADGYGDLVVGAPYEDFGTATDNGAIFVFPGGLDGFGAGLFHFTDAAIRADVPAVITNDDLFGAALAIGDFDLDVQRELVVGAPGRANGAGAIFVFQGGGGEGPIRTPGSWFDSGHLGCGAPAAGDRFGSAFAVGDFNGDGFDDLAVGAPGASGGAGKICVVRGSVAGIADGYGAAYFQNTNGYTPSAVEAGDRFGAALAAGDFDGDGFDDLAIGAPGEAPSADPAGGAVGVWFGKEGAAIGDFFGSGIAYVESNIGVQVVEAGDEFGGALAAISSGGPGESLAIAAPGDPGGARTGLFARVYPEPGGALNGWLYTQSTLCCVEGDEAAEAGDGFGRAMVAADLDGNGLDELAVAAPGEDAGTGVVMLYSDVSLAGFALAQRYDVHDLLPLNGVPHDDSWFGSALAAVDVDGDGRSEIAIGAPLERVGISGAAAGAVYVAPEPSGAALAAVLALLSAGSRRRRSWSSSR